MWHETAQLYLDSEAAVDESLLQRTLSRLPGLHHLDLSRNLQGSWWAGDFTLDLTLAEALPAEEVGRLLQLTGVARLDRVAYRRVAGGEREPDLTGGIWRTLLLRTRPGQDSERIAELERDLLRMPEYMPGIRNWQLSRVCSDSSWTHVWQQEYSRLEDLQGEYLTHPYHWGWVDRWFDPEFAEWTVDAISHAFCPLQSSLLSHPLAPIHTQRQEVLHVQ